MRLFQAALVTIAASLSLYASGFAQKPTSDLTIWNGTTGTVTFGFTNTAGSQTKALPSNYRTVLPCVDTATVSISTGDKPFKAALQCGHAYGLYYDDARQQVVARYLPTVAGPAAGLNPEPAEPLSPLRQLLNNQAAAAANRANLGINAAPK